LSTCGWLVDGREVEEDILIEQRVLEVAALGLSIFSSGVIAAAAVNGPARVSQLDLALVESVGCARRGCSKVVVVKRYAVVVALNSAPRGV